MTDMPLFSVQSRTERPLADLLRPDRLDAMEGISSELGWLRRMYDQKVVYNLLIHGPPGVGKTTLARCLFRNADTPWCELSAVSSTLKDLKPILKQGRQQFETTGRPMGLFIDEIHRFNKAQQDALLPFLEEGSSVLVGATTENPSFSVNRALRSRMRLMKLKALTNAQLVSILKRAWADDSLSSFRAVIEADEIDFDCIAQCSQGDARRALSLLEFALQTGTQLNREGIESIQTEPILNYDKAGDAHYQYASALIKSMRSGDERDAAYWLLRFIDAGGDPQFVFRRLGIFASEDVGNADINALQLVDSAARLFDRIGRPEGDYLLMQAVIYLSRAPKSREVVNAIAQTRSQILAEPDRIVPEHLMPRSPSKN
ncbi:MAG: AAA family ATPase [Bradymonadia bacterium]